MHGGVFVPIYEYQCQECGKTVEKLQKMGSESAGGNCPQCGGNQLKRCLSVPAPARLSDGGPPCGTGSGAVGGCGGCCGNCH